MAGTSGSLPPAAELCWSFDVSGFVQFEPGALLSPLAACGVERGEDVNAGLQAPTMLLECITMLSNGEQRYRLDSRRVLPVDEQHGRVLWLNSGQVRGCGTACMSRTSCACTTVNFAAHAQCNKMAMQCSARTMLSLPSASGCTARGAQAVDARRLVYDVDVLGDRAVASRCSLSFPPAPSCCTHIE